MNFKSLLVSSTILLSGCQSGWWKKEPVRHIARSPSVVANNGKVEITGDSQVAPKVNTKQSETSLALPEGSTFDFNEKLGTLRLTLAKASSLAVSRTETNIDGPRSFTPDKAPTIQEEKQAESDFWVNLGLKAGLVLGAGIAIFGLVRSWDFMMYGGAALSAACGFGIFIERHPFLLLIVGIGITLAVVGPSIWHAKLKRMNETGASNK